LGFGLALFQAHFALPKAPTTDTGALVLSTDHLLLMGHYRFPVSKQNISNRKKDFAICGVVE
jgi:hypothetical protein